MSWKQIFVVLIILILLLMTFAYFFILPSEFGNFGSFSANTNFSDNKHDLLQFYPKMRYQSNSISYKIENCSLQKKDEMLRSFDILENLTVLKFYPVSAGEEVYISCDSHTRLEGDFFIAGEGGPEEIVKTANFNVIEKGKVLLLRESDCETPLVGVHELLHALGFVHSNNPKNIMYNFSKCGQEIGGDVINKINELYSAESLPDLSIESAWTKISGRYLDANVTIRNNGLKSAPASVIAVYADNSKIKEVPLSSLKIGYGSTLTLTNVFVTRISVNEITIKVENNYNELDKLNNKVKLILENKK